MFGPDFYPTPENVIDIILSYIDVQGKTILEPSAGSGNIVDALTRASAKDVLACEKNEKLLHILKGNNNCKVIGTDFLNITADKISHIDAIIMNPPFSEGDKHILHAYNIAPGGAQIIALCNAETVSNLYSKTRRELKQLIKDFGSFEDLGSCFNTSERQTDVHVTLINLNKPTEQGENEFEGFFMEEEPDEQGEGIMPYNFIRDLVQRYITAVELFDKQLSIGNDMNNALSGYFKSGIAFVATEKGAVKNRQDFQNDLKHSGWTYIFNKLRMNKFETAGLREDMNKFIEKQVSIPFTMKNIYRMLEIVIGTHGSRMNKALLEVFERATKHYDENKYYVEGWKTNSHYLLNKKFILPNMCYQDKRYYSGSKIETNYGGYFNLIEDMLKALCYFTGQPFENYCNLDTFLRYPYKVYDGDIVLKNAYDMTEAQNRLNELLPKYPQAYIKVGLPIYGEWFEWGFFKCKCFKKGTIHFEFLDEKVWELVNTTVARLLGYPLFEPKKKKETTPTAEPVKQTAKAGESLVLFNL